MTVSVAIVNWNAGELLRVCVQSILTTTPGVEVVVVDNASSDDSLERLTSFRDQIHIIRNSVNRGFAAAVNQAFAETATPYVLVLNPDVRVLPGAIAVMSAFLNDHPKAGAVGGNVNDKYLPRKLPSVGTLFRENLGFGRPVSALPATGTIEVEQPAAAALLVRRDAYDKIGGFDERFHPAWYEDVDFCRRLKSAGWQIYFASEAEFPHEGGYSVQGLGPKAFTDAYYHNQLRYAQKHFGRAARVSVRLSVAAGMLIRMAARPKDAGVYAGVLRGALGGW